MDQESRPKGSLRPLRMADTIRQEIAKFLLNGVKDDRIGFVTITEVKMTADLQTARVYYTSYGTEKQREESELGLQQSSYKIRAHLGKTLRFRYTPRLEFFFDRGLEHSYKIQKLLGELTPPDDPSDDSEPK